MSRTIEDRIKELREAQKSAGSEYEKALLQFSIDWLEKQLDEEQRAFDKKGGGA